MFNIIVAADLKNGIGKNNKLPWVIKEDLRFFKGMTVGEKNNVVIMGRKTWDSLPESYKPLVDRFNIILSKTLELDTSIDRYKNCRVMSSFDDALNFSKSFSFDMTWVIGGSSVYQQAIEHPNLDLIYLTRINKEYECDTFFEPTNTICVEKKSVNATDLLDKTDVKLDFCIHKLDTTGAEYEYLKVLLKVMTQGNKRNTRNGNTLSLFGSQLRWDLQKGFPLLTTKKMFFRGIVEELLFFIKGETDTNKLMEKRVNIWKGNTTREFLDSRNLDYPEGHMGPMYGYQWRHFNKPYSDEEGGVDQLKNVIEKIKTDPTNRRILMTTYNPAQDNLGVLTPCHSIVLQFYVNDGKLSTHMYQRSADVFLGLPFNIASTSLLTHIIANLTGLDVGEVVFSLGDYHLYESHIEQAKTQLSRLPKNLPKLVFSKELEKLEDLESLEYKDFKIEGYTSHPSIKAQMVV